MTSAGADVLVDAGALQRAHRRGEDEGEDDRDRHRQQQRPGVLEQEDDGDEEQAAAEPGRRAAAAWRGSIGIGAMARAMMAWPLPSARRVAAANARRA